MFLSIFLASCRTQNLAGFLDNLAETAADPSSFEVLIKIDEGSTALENLIKSYQATSPFKIKYISSEKLDGYYTLHVGYDELLQIADPETYFCWLLTDEIRLQTPGWDTLLKKYIGLFADDIFRLKLSIFQAKNYFDFFDCLPAPDNYAVTTRKWLELTGGWGNFWGPDSWHQCVDFYLGVCRNPNDPYGVWRSIPIMDIKVGGQEAGQGIADPQAIAQRALRIAEGWRHHSTHTAQENYFRLAQRLNAHIYATAHGHSQYILEENLFSKQISLYSIDKKFIESWCYKVPKFSIKLYSGYKKINIRRHINLLRLRFFYAPTSKLREFERLWKSCQLLKRKIHVTVLLIKRNIRRTKNKALRALIRKKYIKCDIYTFDGKYLKSAPDILG